MAFFIRLQSAIYVINKTGITPRFINLNNLHIALQNQMWLPLRACTNVGADLCVRPGYDDDYRYIVLSSSVSFPLLIVTFPFLK
jgi:hypothetical protein